MDVILPPMSWWGGFWRWKFGGHGKWDDQKDQSVVLASRGTRADIGNRDGGELDVLVSRHWHWSGVHWRRDMVCPNALMQTIP